jgi:8-oxo-dGTP pyrophosphatase MutT (NUDIX family)
VNPANDLVATAALGSPTPAAVLAALFEEEGEARVVLTRRSPALRAHRGEVSFPGGRLEPGEEVVTGALREASEEVGLDPAGVALAGWLTPVVTFNSRSFIHPVVATLEGRPHLSPNPAEVARVVDVALADLVADGVFDEERWPLPPGRPGPAGAADGTFPVWFFRARGELVWGATARMLYELCCLTLGVPTRWDEARSGT